MYLGRVLWPLVARLPYVRRWAGASCNVHERPLPRALCCRVDTPVQSTTGRGRSTVLTRRPPVAVRQKYHVPTTLDQRSLDKIAVVEKLPNRRQHS